jgi:hypothetical protein
MSETEKSEPVDERRLVRLAGRLKRRLDAIGEILDEHDLELMSGHSTNCANIIQRGTGRVLATLDLEGPWAGGDPVYLQHPDGYRYTPDADF